MFKDKSILVTGATGSFGRRFIGHVLANYRPRRLVIFSRDELKQFEMAREYSTDAHPCLRYFIGDIRDRDRVARACANVDVIVHAAAMKQIAAAEYNPTECIATNVQGAINLIDAAIANHVERVVALSTDKAANPINLYGATKLCSDKLFIAGNNLSGRHHTRFSVVRYGNVFGSRGSVVPHFRSLIATGATTLPITHKAMTRFIITLDQGVRFVDRALQKMVGGEVFVPKLPSMRIVDLASIMLPTGGIEIVGQRPGEKLHEVMIPREESLNSVDMGDYYIIQPAHHWWNTRKLQESVAVRGRKLDEAFEYSSETNAWWLTGDEIRDLLAATAAT